MTHFVGDSSRHRTGSIPGVSTQGRYTTQLMEDNSRIRTGSTPELMPNVARNTPSGGTMPQPDTSYNIHPPPTMGHCGGEFGSWPSHPGAVVVPSKEEPNMQQESPESAQEPG